MSDVPRSRVQMAIASMSSYVTVTRPTFNQRAAGTVINGSHITPNPSMERLTFAKQTCAIRQLDKLHPSLVSSGY